MKEILEAVVSHNSTVDSNLERLVALHYLAFSRHHDVAALESVIGPLQNIQMEGNLLNFSLVIEKVLVEGRKASQSDMAHFVIESLFGSLVSCSEDSERLQAWLKTCRSIVSFHWINTLVCIPIMLCVLPFSILSLQLFTPHMEMILYSSEYSGDYHGKFNMVQAAFLFLQSVRDDATLHNHLRCLTEMQKSEVFAVT